MKYNLSFVIVLIWSQIFFVSCDRIPDPTLTLLRVPLSQDITVRVDSVGGSSDSALFVASISLDANNNADFFSNRSKLAEVDIEKITYRVKEISSGSADSLIEGKFEFLNPSSGQFEVLTEDNNRKLAVDQVVQINIKPEAKSRLISILSSSSPKFDVRMRGKMNKIPISLIIALEIQLSLKTKL